MNRIFCSKDFESEQLKIMCEELGIILSDGGVRFNAVFSKEICGLDIISDIDSVTVKYSDTAYLFRALSIIAEQDNEVFHISEKARFNSNGCMIDCSRNAVMKIDTLKHFIRCMARMGLKMLMLYTEDTYEVEGHPYFGYMRGRYSVDELRELDDYAYSFGIELVPCIQTLGHLLMVLKWQQYDFYRDTEDILYVDKDKTYGLITRMVEACRKSFRTKKIHIGMDEAEMVGRGDYYYLNGDSNKTELLLRHLGRVADICVQNGFEPMIWSDMFFKFANGGDYRNRTPLPQDIADKIPSNVRLVYWEYLKEEPEQYDALIKNHLAVASDVVFAGGLWRWMSFLPSIAPSIRRTKTALTACKENGIREVFTTVWGDGGNDASLYSILPALQFQAELGFYDDVDENQLSKRLKSCTGANLEDFFIIDSPDLPEEKNNGLLNPSKYMLYQDALIGLLDKHIPEGVSQKYAELYKKAKVIADKENKYQYMFKTVEALFGVLELKSELGIQLKTAYDSKDNEFLKKAADVIIPELISRVEKFYECFSYQWFNENKPFGFEVQDQRIGGLILRLKTARKRISDYLCGAIDSIPELAERRLPFGYAKEGDFTCNNSWSRTVTASYI